MCLGVFGLSLYTTERDLREVFSKYGPLTDVCIVYDQQSRRSRGFAFVYFENKEDSQEVCSLLVSFKTIKHGTYHKSVAVYTMILALTWTHGFVHVGERESKWYGAGWSQDPSGLLHHQEATHPYSRDLHGPAHIVSVCVKSARQVLVYWGGLTLCVFFTVEMEVPV